MNCLTYELVEQGAGIKCNLCGLISHNRHDVEQRYCGKCHVFHEGLVDRIVIDAAEKIGKSHGQMLSMARALLATMLFHAQKQPTAPVWTVMQFEPFSVEVLGGETFDALLRRRQKASEACQ